MDKVVCYVDILLTTIPMAVTHAAIRPPYGGKETAPAT
jgi:hypothetical protein